MYLQRGNWWPTIEEKTGQPVYIYIIPIAKVLISHFRYNERLAGLKLRQTYLTWPISKHFPGKNRGTIRSSRKPKLVFLEFQLDYR